MSNDASKWEGSGERDCRQTSRDEVFELGFDEALSGGILLIEWPERLGALLPAERLDVTLEGSGPRYARITGHGSWVDRIREFE